jgi:regulator of sigma E protease
LTPNPTPGDVIYHDSPDWEKELPLLTILGVLVVLGLLISVHETGHFLTARAMGVRVERFSLGFGPKLLAFRRGDTEYRLSLILLGGYVKMAGENPDDPQAGAPDEFLSKKWWQRMLIAIGGPFANLVLAFIFGIGYFLVGYTYQDVKPVIGRLSAQYSEWFQPNDTILAVNGKPIRGWNEIITEIGTKQTSTYTVKRAGETLSITAPVTARAWAQDSLLSPWAPPVIGEVMTGYPAYKAGLASGDVILQVDTTSVADWDDMRRAVKDNPNAKATMRIRRGDREFDQVVDLMANPLATQQKLIGINPANTVSFTERFGLFRSVRNAAIWTIYTVEVNYYGLYKLIRHPSIFKDSVGSPVILVPMSQQIAKRGVGETLSFIGIISILLMVMNLLPIPILDGGLVMFCLIEGIFRKPVPLNWQLKAQQAGFLILVFLMLFGLFSDFSKVGGRFITQKAQASQSVRQE